jgi:hypothetical protein
MPSWWPWFFSFAFPQQINQGIQQLRVGIISRILIIETAMHQAYADLERSLSVNPEMANPPDIGAVQMVARRQGGPGEGWLTWIR